MLAVTHEGLTYKISFHHRPPIEVQINRFPIGNVITPDNLKRPGTSCFIQVFNGQPEPIEAVNAVCNVSKTDVFDYEKGRKYSLSAALKELSSAGSLPLGHLRNLPLREAIWKAYFGRKKPDIRKCIKNLNPKEQFYDAKLYMLVQFNIPDTKSLSISKYIGDWAENLGFKVKPIDELFSNCSL